MLSRFARGEALGLHPRVEIVNPTIARRALMFHTEAVPARAVNVRFRIGSDPADTPLASALRR